MSIVFEVIDVSCEASNASFFVPQIQLVGKSTSTFATLFGYSEFGIPSLPPKKYRTITWNGSSVRTGFTAEKVPRQCAGAKYVFSGQGKYDLLGNLTQSYSKKFYAQCGKQYWPPEPLQTNDFANRTGSSFSEVFVGFCWPDVPQSCATCDPNPANWLFINEQVTNVPFVDVAAFIGAPGDAVITKTSFTINAVFNGLVMVETQPFQTLAISGNISDRYNVTVGTQVLTATTMLTDPASLTFPAEAIMDSTNTFVSGQYIVFSDNNNYSAVLSDEYTDLDALSNAKIVTGAGTTAQNLPRTTGFTSVTTKVDYDLNCSNLMVGKDYLVTVDLWDQTANTHTTKSYGFTASATTHKISDTIATPAAGHSVTVKSPTIAFATP